MAKKEDIEDLALLLLYLSSWQETLKLNNTKITATKAWKNIRFEILDSLNEKNMINSSKTSKSIFLTEEGIKKAKELEKIFFG
jgi:hypothetical protein